MYIKEILCVTAGAVVGGVIGVFCVKRYYEDIAVQEIDEAKEYYRKQYLKVVYGVKDDIEFVDEESAKRNGSESEECEPDYKEIIEKMNYGEFFKKKETPDKEPEKQEIPAAFLISDDDYMIGKRKKRTFMYFESDGVFMDAETEDIVSDGMDLIGERNFEDRNDDEDAFYVRNEITKTDYEVIVEHYAYAESDFREPEDN